MSFIHSFISDFHSFTSTCLRVHGPHLARGRRTERAWDQGTAGEQVLLSRFDLIFHFYLFIWKCVRLHGPHLARGCRSARAGDQGARIARFYYVISLFVYFRSEFVYFQRADVFMGRVLLVGAELHARGMKVRG